MEKSHHLFEAIYENNKRLVYKFIQQAVDAKDLDNYLIDELFQVVWIKVYNNIEKFKNKSKKDTRDYIRAMTNNTIADHFNRQKRETQAIQQFTYLSEDTLVSNHIDEELFPDEMHDFLKTALSLLSKEDLDLIMLKYKYKMNSKSIGNIYEISDAYVRVRLHRIRDYLKKQILIQQENNNK